MSNPFTKSRSKNRVRLPSQSEEERRAIELALQNIEGNVGTQQDLQTLLSAFAEPLISNLIAQQQGGAGATSPFDRRRLEAAREATQASGELLQTQLDLVRSGGIATEEDLERINQAANRAITLGRKDLETATGQAIQNLGRQLAPARGRRRATPIATRLEAVPEEGRREFGDLVRAIRGRESEARLRFPLERIGQLGQVAGRTQELADRLAQFERSLELDSLRARANALGQVGRITTSGSSLFDPLRLAGLLQRERLAQPKRESSQTPSIHEGLVGSSKGTGQVVGLILGGI